MEDLVKCSRCNFRGAQTDFPLKSTGGHLKTCTGCTQKVSNASFNKRHATGTDGPPKKQRRRVQDHIPGDTPALNWQEFLGLLHNNKACAFELRAVVEMEANELSKENAVMTGFDLAWVVARAVRNETGYRFK